MQITIFKSAIDKEFKNTVKHLKKLYKGSVLQITKDYQIIHTDSGLFMKIEYAVNDNDFLSYQVAL